MQPPKPAKKHAPELYSLMNLPPQATYEEVQKSYKTLSKTFHPERLRAQNPGASELAQDTFVNIKAARKLAILSLLYSKMDALSYLARFMVFVSCGTDNFFLSVLLKTTFFAIPCIDLRTINTATKA